MKQIRISKGKIIIAGIGPGSEAGIMSAVLIAIQSSGVIIGHEYCFRFVTHLLRGGTERINTGMKREQVRVEQTLAYANKGKTICMISPGDAGIYGMTPLIYEVKKKSGSKIEIESYPGISASQKAVPLLSVPIGHDFYVIPLSGLMIPREPIEKRIHAVTMVDLVTAIYSSKSEGRYWQLYRLKELSLQERKPETPVGYVRQAGREEQEVFVTTLADLDPEQIDTFTVILIGNSQTYLSGGHIITPREYYGETEQEKMGTGIGQGIMIRSFRTVEKELKNQEIPLDRKRALLHAIHTTADFDVGSILYVGPDAVSTLYNKISDGGVPAVITDIMMAVPDIRKGVLQRLGVEVKCYLQDERVAEMTPSEGVTRIQANICRVAKEYPTALLVFGNAPTVLMELCDLTRKGKATLAGIIAAPVGFVHVQGSKHMAEPFIGVPKLIVEGRKGGSNLATTPVNTILCFNNAEQLKPGRGI